MLIYTLEKESVTGLNGEQTECGHLSCDEYSILRLEDVFGQSGDYIFQMKAKAKVDSVIELVVENENTPISLSTNFQHISLSYENLKVSDKYIEIGFPSGDYWFYNLQLEEGNQETAWSLCLDDLSDAIDLNATWIEQTTQQIGLFAKRSDIDDAKADMKLTADGMITEALKSYVPADKFDDYKIETSTKFEQTDNQFGFYVTKEVYNQLDQSVTGIKETQDNYFQFNKDGLTIGKKDNPYQVVISNAKYQMLCNNNPVMYIEYGELMIPDAVISHKLRLNGYSFELDNIGNMNCQYVGIGDE